MIRSFFAAMVGAAFGAIAIETIRERVQDQLWQPVEAISVGLTAAAAGLIAVFVMAMREPARAKPDCAPELLRRAKSMLGVYEYAQLTGDYREVHRHHVIDAAGARRLGGGYQPIHDGSPRPAPPTIGSSVISHRDPATGRFAKAG